LDIVHEKQANSWRKQPVKLPAGGVSLERGHTGLRVMLACMHVPAPLPVPLLSSHAIHVHVPAPLRVKVQNQHVHVLRHGSCGLRGVRSWATAPSAAFAIEFAPLLMSPFAACAAAMVYLTALFSLTMGICLGASFLLNDMTA